MRREGVFILRYRAFHIFSGVPGSPHVPVLAELFGGPFKVFSTREFPGLEPSTELTRVSDICFGCSHELNFCSFRHWRNTGFALP